MSNFSEHKKTYLIAIGSFFFVLILLSLFLSKGKTAPSSNVPNSNPETPSKEGFIDKSTVLPKSGNEDHISDTAKAVVQTIKIPKSYKTIPVDQTLYEQAYTRYSSQKPQEVKSIIEGEIPKYFIYRDVLIENGVEVPPILQKVTYESIHRQMPLLTQLVNDNLLSKADFAFINAEITPNNSQAPKDLLESYQSKFKTEITNIQQILNEANGDPQLALYNLRNKNDFINDYRGDRYFFGDSNFYKALFNLKTGQISDVLTIGTTGKQAYIVVYPTKIELKKYFTKQQIIDERSKYFTF